MLTGATLTDAPVEFCQFVVLGSLGGRSGSVLDLRNRLRRKRGRFDRWIHISTGPQPDIGLEHKSDNFSIQCSLGSPKKRRMRSRGSPDLRPIPERVRESIYVRKKYVIWTRWRPVPVKNVNYPRAPRNRNSGLVGPHATPPIVNYEYMTSTRREGYFGLPTLGT